VTVSYAIARPTVVLADLWANTKVRSAVLVLGGALLTAACAQIQFPVKGSPVPVTGQTFAVLLAGAALGPRRGSASQLLCLLMGLVGMPVYSDASSGADVLFGATGGYIVGFVVAAYAVGWAAERGWDRTPLRALPVFLIGQVIIFAIGVPWLAVVADYSLAEALDKGFVPFIVGGIVKSALAGALLPAAWWLVRRTDEG